MSEIRPTEVPGLVVSRTIALIDGKDQLQFQTAVDQTCTTEDLDELLDRLNGVVDRQKAIVELGQKRQTLKIAKIQLATQTRLRVEKEAEFRARNSQRRRQARTLTDQQQQSLENIEQAIVGFQADIEVVGKRILELERLIARKPLEPATLPVPAD